MDRISPKCQIKIDTVCHFVGGARIDYIKTVQEKAEQNATSQSVIDEAQRDRDQSIFDTRLYS